ncbi:hypothetical protein GGS20DRAFT_589685 [Poronia punctata]|nr:hypothetical protein GGS20DRAFT_589685 [Poronia punctata]
MASQSRTGGPTSSTPPFSTLEDEIEDEDEYADIFAHIRATDEARARAGDLPGLWMTASNTISHLSSRFVTEPHVDFSGGWTLQLQNLWHLYFVAGKHASSEDMLAPLVLQLIETAQRGLLARNQIGRDGTVEIEHAPIVVQVGDHAIQQYIWQDLPLFVPDMTAYWIQDCARMSRSQRVRISFFWGSLAAASSAPWSYGLCRIALVVLRDTLETQRRLVRAGVEPGGEESENPDRTVEMLTMADLLLAVNAWLMRAGGRIVQLCEAGDGGVAASLAIPVPEEVGQLGPLARAAGVRPVAGGFSTQRWFYWLGRLDEIGAESTPPRPGIMASPFVQRAREQKEVARQVARNMIYVASQSNSTIAQELMRIGRLPLL